MICVHHGNVKAVSCHGKDTWLQLSTPVLTVVSLRNLKNLYPVCSLLIWLSAYNKAENLELIVRFVVSNEKPENQGPKEDALGNKAIMRLLQEFLALTSANCTRSL